MAVEGLAAYPVLLGVYYGVFRIGRHRSTWLENVRLALMALILGAATAIQVGLAFAGTVPPLAQLFGAVSLVGAFTLAGMHFFERLRIDLRPVPLPA